MSADVAHLAGFQREIWIAKEGYLAKLEDQRQVEAQALHKYRSTL